MRLLAILILCIISVGNSQAQLPKITTTENLSVMDNAVDVKRNEGWYQAKPNQLACIFLNTPVGLKHAFEVYEEMCIRFKADCHEEDEISILKQGSVKGELDYERLCIFIQRGTLDINRSCKSNDPSVKLISFQSGSSSTIMLTLVLREKN